MRVLGVLAIWAFSYFTCFSQNFQQNLLIGQFVLDKLEISESFDSNLVRLPPLRWANYTLNPFQDSISITDSTSLCFTRVMSFPNSIEQMLEGQLQMSNDSLKITDGFLFSEPMVFIQKLDKEQLILLERFKMRCVRRTFRRRV
jgi:hypothetical protein